MVMIGQNIDIPFGVRNAGEIDGDANWADSANDGDGGVSANTTLKCPHCTKSIMPFRTKQTKFKGTTYPWCGCDHQDVSQHFISRCSKCKGQYKFNVHIDQ